MDTPTISNLISGASALVATVALVVAIRAQRVNYRLAVHLANTPGRLHAALIEHEFNPDGQLIIQLTCVNGPSEVTLTAISLGITYYERGSFWLPGPSCQFSIESAAELNLFGVTGPDLPKRIDPYDPIVWELPARDTIPWGDRVVYRFKACTGHRDKSLEAEPLDVAHYRGPPSLLFWMRSHHTCNGGLSWCLPRLPERVQGWIYQREPGSGDTSAASKPRS